MKSTTVAAAVAALAGSAAAHGHRHGRDIFAKRAATEEVCVPGCTTIWKTITGEPTYIAPPPKTTSSSVSTQEAVTTSEVPEAPLPTPEPTTFPEPGTYTIPATTVTVSQTTTVCGATSTHVPPGTHTCGGVTTTVTEATTVTCDVPTVITEGTVTTSTLISTEYVCPSGGTYTIGPITTTVTQETDIVYPVPTTIEPGTYTAPEQVVTITETDYVYWCPYTSSGLPTVAPEPTTTPEAPAAPAPEPTSSVIASPVAPEPSPSSSAATPAAPSHGPIRGDDDHFGITYTPYEPSNGNCKTAEAVDADIKTLKEDGFNVIRVYSTDCNTLETVAPACEKYGMQMIVGVFVKASGCTYETPEVKEQVDALASWAKWDMVKLFTIGNEAVMNHFCSAQQLRDLVLTVKSKCSGYTGPYTIAETLNIWEQPEVPAALCDVVDIVGANIHPYFNSAVTPDTAGEFVAGQLDLLNKVCSGKEALNLESGWPTAGRCNGSACPGHQEQATALESIRQACGDKTVFFSLDNDLWKEPGDCMCEQSWGTRQSFAALRK